MSGALDCVHVRAVEPLAVPCAFGFWKLDPMVWQLFLDNCCIKPRVRLRRDAWRCAAVSRLTS